MVFLKNEIENKEDYDLTYDSFTYTLVWSDKFDYTGKSNPENWTCEEGFVRNREFQWYQSENAFYENDFLIIEARRDSITNPNFDS